ncbi:MAG TPA: TMEM175 family protein [Methanoregula sp.]|nr:TMEM175 family protein [Methanoregula sp.]
MSAPLHHIIPKERIGNLNDAIYAFSMTLLVTTISVPPKYDRITGGSPLPAILTGVLPDLLHFFIAFIILAILYYFEHQRFRHLRHLDRPLLCMNIASLSFVCLIPFTTNVAGDYPFDTLGAMLFEINILIIGMIAFFQIQYLRNRRADLVPDLSPAWFRREILWSLIFPAFAIFGLALAAINIPMSPVVFLVAPFIMAILFGKEPAGTRGSRAGTMRERGPAPGQPSGS